MSFYRSKIILNLIDKFRKEDKNMKRFKIIIFRTLLDVEPFKEFYVECESIEEANLISYAYCVTLGLYGNCLEVK